MKKIYLLLSLSLLSLDGFSQEVQYKVVTIIESIVPGGLGRSRIVETKTDVNAAEFTTERVDGKDSKQSDVKRGDVKVDSFAETKILNFFSIAGINFQNIASNDAVITSKMNELAKQGWKLAFVTSGVESDGGKDDGNGIFITRLIFSK
ncbi:hypothetical protein [Arcticibacter sp. MXS-1]|uniref:hypothetical protein n=1 Tax=Arcticibacter sp. MXS-1 TaxID=3341726 RepID=UPI0035A8241D